MPERTTARRLRHRPVLTTDACVRVREQISMRQYGSHLDCRRPRRFFSSIASAPYSGSASLRRLAFSSSCARLLKPAATFAFSAPKLFSPDRQCSPHQELRLAQSDSCLKQQCELVETSSYEEMTRGQAFV